MIVRKEGNNNLDDHVETEGDEPGYKDPDGGKASVPQEALPVRVCLALGERDGEWLMVGGGLEVRRGEWEEKMWRLGGEDREVGRTWRERIATGMRLTTRELRTMDW